MRKRKEIQKMLRKVNRVFSGVYHERMVVSAGCANTASIPRWGNETEVVILRLAGAAAAP